LKKFCTYSTCVIESKCVKTIENQKFIINNTSKEGYMKRLISLILVVALLFAFVGCATVNVKAPAGKKIYLASKPVVSPDKSKKVFYILWGLVPITDNSTVDLLADYPDDSEVAVSTKYAFIDYIINTFAGLLTINCQTVEVQRIK
jgi:hypothetical protein